MHNDDLYQNDGESYQAPAGDYYPKTENPPQKSQQELADSISEWLQQQVADCDNIDNIQITELVVNGVSRNITVSVEAQVMARQLLKQKLMQIAAEYDQLRGKQ